MPPIYTQRYAHVQSRNPESAAPGTPIEQSMMYYRLCLGMAMGFTRSVRVPSLSRSF